MRAQPAPVTAGFKDPMLPYNPGVPINISFWFANSVQREQSFHGVVAGATK